MSSARIPVLASVPAPAVRLGRYRLLLELGQGAMARVFVAFSSGLGGFNKLVVVKVMRDELREDEGSLAMFLAEARLAARMNHSNVVQTLEVGEDSGRYFICMEYLEGQTLGRLLKKTIDAPLPLGARLELVCQVLEALVYMHGFADPDGTPLSLVHRDISPNNIFITFEGLAKILDFGVAKATGISHATEAGTFKGKLGYAAPEQILGSAEQRSDIFAVGVLLWELLTYRRFSQDRTQQEVVQARMTGVDPELMRQALGVPVELLQICTRAAAKRVEDRYSSAADMRDALRAYIRTNNLEFSPVQMRAVIGDLYAEERAEIRRLVDQRMKQAVLEDNQPGTAVQPIPVAPAVLGGGTGTATLTANAATFLPPRPASARLKWFASVAAVAALATIGARWLSKSDGTPRVAASSSAASGLGTSAAGTTATGAAPKLVTLKIAATPADTEILLDGARLEGNPFTGQFPKNMALHRLELRSAGRVTEARMIRLDQDLDLLIALPMDKVPSTRARSVAAGAGLPFAPLNEGPSASKPPSSRGPDAAPSTVSPGDAVALPRRERSAPVRPIDDTDPYGK